MPPHPDRVRRNYPEGVPQYTVDAKKETSESLGVPTRNDFEFVIARTEFLSIAPEDIGRCGVLENVK